MSFPDSIEISEWLPMVLSLAVKSIVLLSAAILLTRMLRVASARLRHILWCVGLSSLLVLPILSLVFQPIRVAVLPADLFSSEQLTTQQDTELPTQISRLDAASQGVPNSPVIDGTTSASGSSWQLVLVFVWLTGVLLVLCRYLAGIVAVRRLVAHGSELSGTSWSSLLSELSQRIHLKRGVRLIRSDQSVMPMTCGSFSPILLLPSEAETWSADRRRVVLLHELIHVKRRDLLMQAIAQIVCALYWFNPLVWFAVRRLRTEQELACDEHVVATGIKASDYAEHLFEIARKFQANAMSAIPTTGMARPTHLQHRLCAILTPTSKSGRFIGVWVVVMIGVFITAAFIQLVPVESQVIGAALDVVDNVTTVETETEARGLSPSVMRVTTDPAIVRAREEVSPSPTPVNSNEPVPHASEALPGQTAEKVLSDFTPEEWERLRSNGIGPEYIHEMAEAGYPQLTVDELIALFSNHVRARDVAGYESVGYANLSIRDLLSLKTNGITPEVIASYHTVKHASFEAKKYTALRSNGVTLSYLKSLADLGYDSLSANKAIEMRLAGITAEFINDARSRGYVNLSPNDLIELKRRETN